MIQRVSTIEKNEGFYQVMRQPIWVSDISVHDIGTMEANSLGLKNVFVIVQRNEFYQVIGVFTVQAHTVLGKVCAIFLSCYDWERQAISHPAITGEMDEQS